MMLLRSRHRELDKMRTLDHDFNYAWLMFFGTKPPGINPAGVFFTADEEQALADGLPAFAINPNGTTVEPYDGRVHNKPGMG